MLKGKKRIKVQKKRKKFRIKWNWSFLRNVNWKNVLGVLSIGSLIFMLGFFVYSAFTTIDEKQMEIWKEEVFPKMKVEIYNASDYDGLAKKLTWYMRENNFDVVYYGNSKEKLEKTVIVDRVSEDMKYAKMVRKFLGGGYIKYEPDIDRLTTITIFIGKDFLKIMPEIANYRKLF